MNLRLALCLLVLLASVFLASASPVEREKRIFKSFKSVINTVKDKAKGVVDKGVSQTKKLAKDVGDGVKGVAGDIGDGVTDTAKYTAKVSKKIGKGVSSITQKAYRITYNKAKKSFNSIKGLAGKVDFDAAVDVLTDMIDSELTNSICTFSCVASAVYVMGPPGEMFGQMACPPLCSASLAKLEDVAG